MIIIFDDKAYDDRVLVTVSASQPHLLLDQRDNQQRLGVGVGIGMGVGGPINIERQITRKPYDSAAISGKKHTKKKNRQTMRGAASDKNIRKERQKEAAGQQAENMGSTKR